MTRESTELCGSVKMYKRNGTLLDVTGLNSGSSGVSIKKSLARVAMFGFEHASARPISSILELTPQNCKTAPSTEMPLQVFTGSKYAGKGSIS